MRFWEEKNIMINKPDMGAGMVLFDEAECHIEMIEVPMYDTRFDR